MFAQSGNDLLQFYPTPPALAKRMWAKFKDRDFVRVLEPSAGDGALVCARPGYESGRGRAVTVDCWEIDITRHEHLRKCGFSVTGFDFLTAQSGSFYSHCIMNPPFAAGAAHVLKAWSLLWDAEIVAIVNAESVRNPFSQERKQLVQLIADHGEVEFISGAFAGDEANRKTDVEVALIWLKKTADVRKEVFGDMLEALEQDTETGAGLSGGYNAGHEVALPASEIEHQVRLFNIAVETMRQAVVSEAKAGHYAALIGKTMADLSAGTSDPKKRDYSVATIRGNLATRYGELKDRAWTSILRSTNVTDRLSAKAQKRLEAEFDTIKDLEFTVANIYGFLCGLIDKQSDIQCEMVEDVFDEISRHHEDNCALFKGWKSNTKHRTAAMRIRYTRFILPHNGSYSHSLDWDAERRLADFDKTFSLLDGKRHDREGAYGLVRLFRERFDDLRRGQRLASDFFEVRYYPGVGTIHFYTKRRDLIDRLNRIVGARRQWIPEPGCSVHPDFWAQYENAERYDKEIRAAIKKSTTRYWDNPLHRMGCRDEAEWAPLQAQIDRAIDEVLTSKGLVTEFMLEGPRHAQLALIAA